MEYQQCRYKKQVTTIPVRHINRHPYVFLDDVHDDFPDIGRFSYNGKPIAFENDEQNNRLKPKRIKAIPDKIIDCHKSVYKNKATSGNHDNSQSERLNEVYEIARKTDENIRILKENTNAISCLTFELQEFTVPRMFIVLPENTTRYNLKHWFHFTYRLHFLCECENGEKPHFTCHEDYKITQPRRFLRKYGSYLRKMLILLKYTIYVGSLIIPQLTHISSEIQTSVIPKDRAFWNNLSTRIEQLDEILTEVEKNNYISTKENIQCVEGVELRELQSFLKKNDDHRQFGNLYRSVTNDGHVQWVCIQHYDTHYGEKVIKNLREDFQRLGGEIKGDVAIIQGKYLTKLSKIFDVIRKGLLVFSVILKDLTLQKEVFDKFLSDVSKQSAIHNLDFENITVSSFPCNMKIRDIISKLNETVKKNDKLNIKYSFTKPLSKFNWTLINVINDINSRLVLRIQSQEDTPSLVLTGTNKTEFTLSINNSSEKENISYHTAINNILSEVFNITNICLHNGIMSENIWTSFYQFLTKNESLQELFIDCHLTSKQTEELSSILRDNRTLQTLHMLNVWKREDELNGCSSIFQMLCHVTDLTEVSLTCHTNSLQLEFVARCLLLNNSLRTLRLPKCMIDKNTNITPIEDFLRKTSIHTLSLELVSTNCETSLQRLARAIDENKILETLQLNGLDCCAVFHRKQHIPDNNINAVDSSPTEIRRKHPSRNKLKRFIALFTCHKGDYSDYSQEETTLLPTAHIETHSKKSVSVEPFYSICNHPSFYQQLRENTQNLELEELQVTIKGHVEIDQVTLSMKSNSTVTHLRIDRRILIETDIEMLVEGLHVNTTITQISLNKIKISISHFHQIFDALYDNQTLCVLEVRHCVDNSDHKKLTEKIKVLESKNPFLKIVYENQ